MAQIVQYQDIDFANAISFSATTSDQEMVPSRLGKPRRNQIVITNTSATETVTISKGDYPVTAGKGIILKPSAAYYESDDSSFSCFQGAFHVVGTAAATVTYIENIPY